jgi:hypothetical protein
MLRNQRLLSHLTHLNDELNPICHLLALLGAHHILHVSRIKIKSHLSSADIIRSSTLFHVSRIRVKYHLPPAGIIRSSPYSPR